MKHQFSGKQQTFRALIVTLLTVALAMPVALADPRGVRSTNRNASRNVNVNQNRNVNFNQNQNINVNRNQNINVNVNKHVDVDVHHSGYYGHNDNDNFWGGFAAGVATTMVVGAIVRSAPANSQPVVVNNVTYVVCDGVYYQQNPGGYVVVNPPIGVTVGVLPAGATQVIVNGQVYYVVNGIHYRPAMQNGVTVYTTVAF